MGSSKHADQVQHDHAGLPAQPHAAELKRRRFSAAALAACLAFAPAWHAQAQSGDRPGEKQEAPPVKAPPAPALSPEAALKTLRVAPGFRVEIVASDPLLFDPVAMSIGPDGRMWVVEMRAYMPNVEGAGENAPIGTIATLEDTNKDGRMDKRTEFANGLVLPRALALVGDGVLVAEPPNLWFMRDTNGDGKADDKQLIANDYGNPSNPEHSANGLLWGFDNWIYSANHTTRFRYQAGKWRREPTAFRGQWGIAQDDFGQLYFNNNSVALYTDALPAEYLLRNRHLPNPSGANVQMARADEISVWPARVNTGVNRGYRILREDGTLPVLTAACGPAIYRGSMFPESFRGDAFIAEPAGNLVKRLKIEERDGVPHVRNAHEQTEFLASTDERFRPVSVYNGPDGSLYVVDMYRGVIQHRIFLTTYLRNQIKERGLEAPLGMGRVYRIVPENAPRRTIPNLAKASSAQLASALDHDEAWVRETAQRLLVERHDASSATALRRLVTTSPRAATRVHALWTLDGIDAIDWPTAAAALRDPEARVAATGVRVSERFLTAEPERTVALLERARWSEPAVVRQVALSLGSAPPKLADAALLEIAEQAGSLPFVADAIVSSIAGREFAFATTLIGSDAAGDIPSVSPVLAVATATVLHSGNAEQTQALLDRLTNPKTTPWVRTALLDGVDRLIPRADDGSRRMAFLPAEPRALVALASSKDVDAPRAALLLKSLRWRGATVDAAASLAKLTPEQRERYEKGRSAFAVCAACHQDEGQGMTGLAPALAGSSWVNGSPQALVRIVLNGKVDQLAMPGLGGSLDDATIAAILTYVRRSWGNEASPIEPSTVESIRGVVSHRDEPWSDEELQPLR